MSLMHLQVYSRELHYLRYITSELVFSLQKLLFNNE